jgi:hypothetical protein
MPELGSCFLRSCGSVVVGVVAVVLIALLLSGVL